jgi:ABC-2 type transport system ATP-binding protein
MIEVKGLSKRYGDFHAVNGITFSANKGEIVGFLGSNGAGKTTTMRMLVTFLPPTAGTATIAGFDIQTQADEVRKRIGYLPENPPLYNEMTVQEYLSFMGEIRGVAKREIKARVENTMERCFLTNVHRKLCGHLSKGYRQRVGLAQAILHDPQVMILDEPTSGLDPKQIVEIRKLICSLAENHTVILSTHILQEVTEVCSKVVIISNGQIVREDSLSDLVKEKDLEQVFLESIMATESRNVAENGSGLKH